DGSGAAGQAALDALPWGEGLWLVRHARNRGKGAALRAGFAAARRLGFSHAISLDADGQHLPADLPAFLGAIAREPGALVLGERDLVRAGAGWGSRSGRRISNAWFRLLSGGQRLSDTQTGFRAYPLASLAALELSGERYELEVEVLAKAAWAGVPLRTIPIRVRYFRGAERISHMGLADFARISAAWLGLLLARPGGAVAQPRRLSVSAAAASPPTLSSPASSSSPATSRSSARSVAESPGASGRVNLALRTPLSASERPRARPAAQVAASSR
ncbi:MAG TPA: hypothetical protein DEA08_31595, partial [Planctomycetes bacterium]|nr:hypothetical protein [Planctomycetota bacterium]